MPRGESPRLLLKPAANHSGRVDGAWWPRSDDLVTEVANLVAALRDRMGLVDRVQYRASDWAGAPRNLLVAGHAMHLDGHRLQPHNTIDVLGVSGHKITLLVVPPHSEPDHAHATMAAAAQSTDSATVDGLLMVSFRDRESRNQRGAAQERWESEGGR